MFKTMAWSAHCKGYQLTSISLYSQYATFLEENAGKIRVISHDHNIINNPSNSYEFFGSLYVTYETL